MFTFWLLLLSLIVFSCSSPCTKDFEETICENLKFSPELQLDSSTNRLTIRNASGVIIHENFAKLTNVTELRIISSQIEGVEPGALCCTSNLTSITIVKSKFPDVTKTNLNGCENLKSLSFDGDFKLEKGAFLLFTNLQSLSINGTVLDELDEEMFTGLDSLKTLTIHYSKIHTIKSDAFRGIKNVKVVDLQNNEIETVAAGAFKNLPLLKVLNLSDNKITNLTWDEFDNLESLMVLFLERNDFSTVDPEKLIKNAPNLERIFLSYDKLTPNSRKKVENVFPKHKVNVIYSGYKL